MAVLRPFSALRFNREKAGAPETLCCPPYDIIPDPSVWLSKNPYNIIRLEGGERLGTPNPYADAEQTLSEWLNKGILQEDETPSFYIYESIFPSQHGGMRTLTGFAAHVELSPFADGVVLPHENTLSAAKADRRELMRATGCHFSPVYALYDDPSRRADAILKTVKDTPPYSSFAMEDGIEYRLWLLSDSAACRALEEVFRDQSLFIADGHHRYETSLRLREENPDTVSPYIMMFLADMSDPGLEVHATHRIVSGIPDYDQKALYEKISQRFEMEAGDETKEGSLIWVTPKKRIALTPKAGEERFLDVTLLHEGILEPFFGIDTANMAAGGNLTYTRSSEEAIAAVQSGGAQCAFLMAPPTVAQIRETMLRGEKMPQKSTYFYPKIITGLFMNRFEK